MSSSELLPEGWIKVDWDALTSFDGFRRGPFGGNLKKSFFVDSGFAVYEQYAPINDDCTRFRYFIDKEKYEELSSFWVEDGDFLISCSGTMGRITQVPEGAPAGVINQALLRIRLAKNFINPDFFIKLFRSPSVQDNVLTKSGGGAIQNLASVKELKVIKLPLPPLAEQKIIADKLDTLLAQVESTKARLERIPNILKSFRQSVLAAAVSGKLTEEWREYNIITIAEDFVERAVQERKIAGIKESKHSKKAMVEGKPFDIPNSWGWYRLGCLALKITDGAHNTPKVLDSGFPYVMAKDLTGGKLDFSENRYISEKDHRELYLKCMPTVNDLLVVNIGAGTGNNVLIDTDKEFSFKNIAIVKRPSFIVGAYLKIFFDSQKQRIFDEQTQGGAQPFLSLTVLNNITFALPPVDEQTEIVRRVEELFAFADTIEQKANAALDRVNNLTQSILAKAFRGELTADWRAANPDLISGENSAEALLEKIKAERKAMKKQPK